MRYSMTLPGLTSATVIPQSAAAYIHIASVAIAAYDYLVTLPAEWSIYYSQRGRGCISVSCALFIAIRYTSIAVISVSSYTFFFHGFSKNACNHWYLAPVALKVVQAMASQAIMAWRMYIVSRRRPFVKWFLIVFSVVACVGEWVASLVHRTSVNNGNCRSVNIAKIPTAWLFYLITSIYDVVTTSTVLFYLTRLNSTSHLTTRLKKLLIYHGLIYFFAILAVNLLNIIIYLSDNDQTQSAFAPIAYTLTWIFSQKFLIHLHELGLKEKAKEQIGGVQTIIVTVTHPTEIDAVSSEVSRAVQTSFDTNTEDKESFSVNLRVRTRRRSSISSSLKDQRSDDVENVGTFG